MTTNPKCVCVFSNFYPPVVSGSSVQVEGLCRELVRQGWTPVVVTAHVVPGSAESEVVNGIHVYRLPSFRLPAALTLGFNFPWLGVTFTPSNVGRIRKIIELHKPSVMHLHNYMFDLSLSASYMRWATKLPLVLTIHTYLRHPSWIVNAVFYFVEQAVLKPGVVSRADCIVCPDMNVVDYARRNFKNTRSALVPYGIHHSKPEPNAREDLLRRFKLHNKRIVLSVGHLHPMRNRRDLFLAWPEIVAAVPDAVLLVVGDVSIPLPDELVKSQNFSNSIIFSGPLPHTEVSALLEMAELEAHWLNQEKAAKTSPGIASLEAMAMGVPVLTAANPDTYGKGVLENGKNIMIVEPDRAGPLAATIISLLRDEELRKSIGEAAAKTVRENFLWESVCKRTIDVYESVKKKLA
ncbi:glycosyltransferase family 4 protein [Polaromonas sp. YR568]|uniref:glycosyltransferase family 4 protein n=1 Tax=Polaromonas sp. YR568 TaxID=1855301 RepID=UPI00398BEE95